MQSSSEDYCKEKTTVELPRDLPTSVLTYRKPHIAEDTGGVAERVLQKLRHLGMDEESMGTGCNDIRQSLSLNSTDALAVATGIHPTEFDRIAHEKFQEAMKASTSATVHASSDSTTPLLKNHQENKTEITSGNNNSETVTVKEQHKEKDKTAQKEILCASTEAHGDTLKQDSETETMSDSCCSVAESEELTETAPSQEDNVQEGQQVNSFSNNEKRRRKKKRKQTTKFGEMQSAIKDIADIVSKARLGGKDRNKEEYTHRIETVLRDVYTRVQMVLHNNQEEMMDKNGVERSPNAPELSGTKVFSKPKGIPSSTVTCVVSNKNKQYGANQEPYVPTLEHEVKKSKTDNNAVPHYHQKQLTTADSSNEETKLEEQKSFEGKQMTVPDVYDKEKLSLSVSPVTESTATIPLHIPIAKKRRRINKKKGMETAEETNTEDTFTAADDLKHTDKVKSGGKNEHNDNLNEEEERTKELEDKICLKRLATEQDGAPDSSVGCGISGGNEKDGASEEAYVATVEHQVKGSESDNNAVPDYHQEQLTTADSSNEATKLEEQKSFEGEQMTVPDVDDKEQLASSVSPATESTATVPLHIPIGKKRRRRNKKKGMETAEKTNTKDTFTAADDLQQTGKDKSGGDNEHNDNLNQDEDRNKEPEEQSCLQSSASEQEGAPSSSVRCDVPNENEKDGAIEEAYVATVEHQVKNLEPDNNAVPTDYHQEQTITADSSNEATKLEEQKSFEGEQMTVPDVDDKKKLSSSVSPLTESTATVPLHIPSGKKRRRRNKKKGMETAEKTNTEDTFTAADDLQHTGKVKSGGENEDNDNLNKDEDRNKEPEDQSCFPSPASEQEGAPSSSGLRDDVSDGSKKGGASEEANASTVEHQVKNSETENNAVPHYPQEQLATADLSNKATKLEEQKSFEGEQMTVPDVDDKEKLSSSVSPVTESTATVPLHIPSGKKRRRRNTKKGMETAEKTNTKDTFTAADDLQHTGKVKSGGDNEHNDNLNQDEDRNKKPEDQSCLQSSASEQEGAPSSSVRCDVPNENEKDGAIEEAYVATVEHQVKNSETDNNAVPDYHQEQTITADSSNEATKLEEQKSFEGEQMTVPDVDDQNKLSSSVSPATDSTATVPLHIPSGKKRRRRNTKKGMETAEKTNTEDTFTAADDLQHTGKVKSGGENEDNDNLNKDEDRNKEPEDQSCFPSPASEQEGAPSSGLKDDVSDGSKKGGASEEANASTVEHQVKNSETENNAVPHYPQEQLATADLSNKATKLEEQKSFEGEQMTVPDVDDKEKLSSSVSPVTECTATVPLHIPSGKKRRRRNKKKGMETAEKTNTEDTFTAADDLQHTGKVKSGGENEDNDNLNKDDDRNKEPEDQSCFPSPASEQEGAPSSSVRCDVPNENEKDGAIEEAYVATVEHQVKNSEPDNNAVPDYHQEQTITADSSNEATKLEEQKSFEGEQMTVPDVDDKEKLSSSVSPVTESTAIVPLHIPIGKKRRRRNKKKGMETAEKTNTEDTFTAADDLQHTGKVKSGGENEDIDNLNKDEDRNKEPEDQSCFPSPASEPEGVPCSSLRYDVSDGSRKGGASEEANASTVEHQLKNSETENNAVPQYHQEQLRTADSSNEETKLEEQKSFEGKQIPVLVVDYENKLSSSVSPVTESTATVPLHIPIGKKRRRRNKKKGMETAEDTNTEDTFTAADDLQHTDKVKSAGKNEHNENFNEDEDRKKEPEDQSCLRSPASEQEGAPPVGCDISDGNERDGRSEDSCFATVERAGEVLSSTQGVEVGNDLKFDSLHPTVTDDTDVIVDHQLDVSESCVNGIENDPKAKKIVQGKHLAQACVNKDGEMIEERNGGVSATLSDFDFEAHFKDYVTEPTGQSARLYIGDDIGMTFNTPYKVDITDQVGMTQRPSSQVRSPSGITLDRVKANNPIEPSPCKMEGWLGDEGKTNEAELSLDVPEERYGHTSSPVKDKEGSIQETCLTSAAKGTELQSVSPLSDKERDMAKGSKGQTESKDETQLLQKVEEYIHALHAGVQIILLQTDAGNNTEIKKSLNASDQRGGHRSPAAMRDGDESDHEACLAVTVEEKELKTVEALSKVEKNMPMYSTVQTEFTDDIKLLQKVDAGVKNNELLETDDANNTEMTLEALKKVDKNMPLTSLAQIECSDDIELLQKVEEYIDEVYAGVTILLETDAGVVKRKNTGCECMNVAKNEGEEAEESMDGDLLDRKENSKDSTTEPEVQPTKSCDEDDTEMNAGSFGKVEITDKRGTTLRTQDAHRDSLLTIQSEINADPTIGNHSMEASSRDTEGSFAPEESRDVGKDAANEISSTVKVDEVETIETRPSIKYQEESNHEACSVNITEDTEQESVERCKNEGFNVPKRPSINHTMKVLSCGSKCLLVHSEIFNVSKTSPNGISRKASSDACKTQEIDPSLDISDGRGGDTCSSNKDGVRSNQETRFANTAEVTELQAEEPLNKSDKIVPRESKTQVEFTNEEERLRKIRDYIQEFYVGVQTLLQRDTGSLKCKHPGSKSNKESCEESVDSSFLDVNGRMACNSPANDVAVDMVDDNQTSKEKPEDLHSTVGSRKGLETGLVEQTAVNEEPKSSADIANHRTDTSVQHVTQSSDVNTHALPKDSIDQDGTQQIPQCVTISVTGLKTDSNMAARDTDHLFASHHVAIVTESASQPIPGHDLIDSERVAPVIDFISLGETRTTDGQNIVILDPTKIPSKREFTGKKQFKSVMEDLLLCAQRFIQDNVQTDSFVLTVKSFDERRAYLRSRKWALRLYKLLKDRYSARLTKCILFKPSFKLSALTKLSLPFVSPHMRGKIVIVKSRRAFTKAQGLPEEPSINYK